jgi:hypothetical protein
MKKSDIATAVSIMADGLAESLDIYETAKQESGYVNPGYNIDRQDSKENIKRRITVMRDMLLRISKEL